ncbi:protein mono-ADP-ribosyltransferase PARP15-like isoform X2 [Nycticebus coucang]|uniref:protein mono-ADP-ribosyltransferase PARP15-like isoform X2 n=1 Tax=Nycticebus coucang TaxID=9470 RepID=UPI00234DC956|nr:protein mono-ADP-ribosyltransferase PARP15-like isoform X2 [Nycticebus coucang]
MSRIYFSKKDYLSNRNVLASTQTCEGLTLKLISGDVQFVRADVIVNTVPRDLQLGGGPLSLALLKKAGPHLQKELNARTHQTNQKVGSMFMTSGCNLDCKAVLHVVAPRWKKGAGASEKIMARIIKKCLKTVELLSFSSITFPLIGTGNLKFPKATFVELLFSEVFKFSSSSWQRNLKEVHILVYTSDGEGRQAFLDEFARRSGGNPNDDEIFMPRDTQGIFRTDSNPVSVMHQMKIGAVTFQVANGDITRESVDVIVNSTTRTFNLKSGVSKAILEAAGEDVEYECAVRAAQPHRDYIITQSGNLNCKIIMHILGENNVRRTVSTVLEECELRKYTSVSLPAIGTGMAGKNPTEVADSIIDAIVDYTRKHPNPSLKTVRVVIFQDELLPVFRDIMEKRNISVSPVFQSMFFKAAQLTLDDEERLLNTFLRPDTSFTTNNIPEHWTDMNHQLCSVVPLQPGQSEYNTVEDKFTETCSSYTIEKIEKIQNKFLWDSYQLKKKHMDYKNGHTNNEKLLFHGTDAASVPLINQHGFNRSLAGKRATAYGKGTYFAVDASYSAQDTYSTPDSSGRKHMYLVRVLTGDYTRGNAGLVTPPPKNPFNPTDLFDSVTDDRRHPQMFVVFSDNQAYPEYLITFRR